MVAGLAVRFDELRPRGVLCPTRIAIGAQALDGAIDRGLALGRVGRHWHARADRERRAVEAYNGHEEGVVGRGDARLDKLFRQVEHLFARQLDLLAGEVAVGVRRAVLSHPHAATEVDHPHNVYRLAGGVLQVGQCLRCRDLDERDARIAAHGGPAEHLGLRTVRRNARLFHRVGEEVKVGVTFGLKAEAEARRLHRGRRKLDAARLVPRGFQPVRRLAAALGVQLGGCARRQAELRAVLGRRADLELKRHVVGRRLHGKIGTLKRGLAVALRKQVRLPLDVVAREHKMHREGRRHLRPVAALPCRNLDGLSVRLLVDGLQACALFRRSVESFERRLRLLDRLVLALVVVAVDRHVGIRQRSALEARQLARDARRQPSAVGKKVGKVPFHGLLVKGEGHLVGAEFGRLRGGLEGLLGTGNALVGRLALIGLLARGLTVERIFELLLQPELSLGRLVGGDGEARIDTHLV